MKENSQKKILVDLLKENWLSNYKIDQILRSASGQRRLREIRKNPPEGYKLTEAWIDKNGEIPRHKVFKLISASIRIINKGGRLWA